MTFNPDNLIFFYLTGALIAVAFAIIYFADRRGSDKDEHRKHGKP